MYLCMAIFSFFAGIGRYNKKIINYIRLESVGLRILTENVSGFAVDADIQNLKMKRTYYKLRRS